MAAICFEGVKIQSLETVMKVKQILDYLFAFYTQIHTSNKVDLSRPTIPKYIHLMGQNNQMKDKKVVKERLFYIPKLLEILS